MFGLGIWEIAVICVVALLVLGPQKLPEAAKSLGKALRDFRRAGDDLKREMIGDIDAEPNRPQAAIVTQAVPDVVPVGDEKPADAPPPAESAKPDAHG